MHKYIKSHWTYGGALNTQNHISQISVVQNLKKWFPTAAALTNLVHTRVHIHMLAASLQSTLSTGILNYHDSKILLPFEFDYVNIPFTHSKAPWSSMNIIRWFYGVKEHFSFLFQFRIFFWSVLWHKHRSLCATHNHTYIYVSLGQTLTIDH